MAFVSCSKMFNPIKKIKFVTFSTKTREREGFLYGPDKGHWAERHWYISSLSPLFSNFVLLSLNKSVIEDHLTTAWWAGSLSVAFFIKGKAYFYSKQKKMVCLIPKLNNLRDIKVFSEGSMHFVSQDLLELFHHPLHFFFQAVSYSSISFVCCIV